GAPGVPEWTGARPGGAPRFPNGKPSGNSVVNGTPQRLSGSDEALPDPLGDRLDAVLGPQRDLDVADDALDGAVGVAQLLGDLLGVGPRRQHPENLEAPGAQPGH